MNSWDVASSDGFESGASVDAPAAEGDDNEPANTLILKAPDEFGQLDLRSCRVDDSKMESFAVYLYEEADVIKSIDLSVNTFSHIGVRALASVFKAKANAVTYLNLADNVVSDDGAAHLAEILRTNITLTSLNLQRCHLLSPAAESLASALQTNRTLVDLNLSDNLFSSQDVVLMMTALEVGCVLRELDLSHTQVGEPGAEVVARLLRGTCLQTLKLEKTGLGAKGTASIATALAENRSLITLNLRGNSMQDKGAEHIANAISGHTTLSVLNIMNNDIEDAGMTHIIDSLKTCYSLTAIHLSNNDISSKCAAQVAEAMESNASLTNVTIRGSDLSRDIQARIRSATQANTSGHLVVMVEALDGAIVCKNITCEDLAQISASEWKECAAHPDLRSIIAEHLGHPLASLQVMTAEGHVLTKDSMRSWVVEQLGIAV